MTMNRGFYTVSFFEQTIAAASGDYDLFELDAAADKPIEIVAVFIGNKSEVGDAQEEMVSYSISRFTGGTFTSGNGTATTPVKIDSNDGAASFAAETVGATIATTTGTLEHVHQDTFNIRTGLQLILPPEMRPKCSGAANEAMVVRLRTALADDATVSGTLYVVET
jgi:hypothetical protein